MINLFLSIIGWYTVIHMDSEHFLTFQIVSNKGRYYAFLFTIPQLVFWLGRHSIFLLVLITSVGDNTVCSVKKLQNYQDKGLSTLGQTRIVPIKSKDKFLFGLLHLHLKFHCCQILLVLDLFVRLVGTVC